MSVYCLLVLLAVCVTSSDSDRIAPAPALRGRWLEDTEDAAVAEDFGLPSESEGTIISDEELKEIDEMDKEADSEDDDQAAPEADIHWLAVFMSLGGGISFFLSVFACTRACLLIVDG